MKLLICSTIFLISSISYAVTCVNHSSVVPDGTSSRSGGNVFWCSDGDVIKALDCGNCPLMTSLKKGQEGNCSVISQLNSVEEKELQASLCDKVSNRACCADAGSYKVTYIRN